MKRRFYQCCVNWPEKDVPQLSQMIEDARDISRRTFLRHIHRPDLDDLAAQMSYAKHTARGSTTSGIQQSNMFLFEKKIARNQAVS